MKFLILILSCLSLAVCEKTHTLKLLSQEKLEDDNVELFLKQLEDISSSISRKRNLGDVVANLNDYVDQILVNLGQNIINNGYDPFKLPDQVLHLPITGTINLNKGWLRDLCTIARYNDAELSYSSADKTLLLNLDIQFEVLQFTYDYITEVPPITLAGEVDGKVESVKIELALSYDFHTYNVTLESFNIMDTGKISIEFSGENMIDWITNAMTGVITNFLHPLILGIIQNIIKGPLEDLIKAINDAISNIIHA